MCVQPSLTSLFIPFSIPQAIAKIREFLLQKIYQFRKPMTNYQVPQNAMLKFRCVIQGSKRQKTNFAWLSERIAFPPLLSCRFFNEFLMSNERTIAREVRDEYVETMNKIYYSYFKSYTSRLMKLQVILLEHFTSKKFPFSFASRKP